MLGIDLSLTATGMCDCDGTWTIKPKQLKGMPRLRYVRDEIMKAARQRDFAPVAIEGYSFGSRGRATFSTGELGGVVRLALFEANVIVHEIPPANLKKFATGKGNAPKDKVLSAAIRAGFPGDDNNEADAWWLYQMLQRIEGVDKGKLHQYQADALASLGF